MVLGNWRLKLAFQRVGGYLVMKERVVSTQQFHIRGGLR